MSLRRVVFALAVLCLFVGLASAQVQISTPLTCTVSSLTPTLRAESTHELVGDVLIQCTGGTAFGNPTLNQVPAVDITVNYGTAITSRTGATFSANNNTTYTPTDTALVIDDPNSTATPLVANYGPGALLVDCNTLPAAGSSSPACNTYQQLINGYYVSDISGLGGGTSANVYQGYLTGGGQAVTFYAVPVNPPVSAGIYRRFRITNVRVAPGSSTVTANVTISGPNTATVQIPGSTSTSVGTGQTGFAYSMANAVGATAAAVVSQCITPTPLANPPVYSPYVSLLSYKQNFNNAAKTLNGVTYAAGPPATLTQNAIAFAGPGLTVYGSYNNESGPIYPVFTHGTVNANGANSATPGAADAATEFKAVFSGLPYNSTISKVPQLYVSTYNVSSFTADGSSGGVGSGSTSTVAGLNAAAGNPTSEFSQFALAGGGGAVSGGTILAVPLATQSNGTATAVWDVLNAKTNGTYTFAVYIAYGSTTAALSSVSVTMTAAPIQPATQPTGGEAVQIPSFSTSVAPNPVLSIVPCQTALLFPFVSTTKVSATQHWETGIAISNTGGDPWSSVPSTNAGTCTLTFYGSGVATGASTLSPPTVTGPSIPLGSNWAFVASDPLQTGTAPNVGFAGYMFAVCNFSYAHGFAFIEDMSPAGNAMGYLALVVNNGINLPRNVSLNGEQLEN